VSGRRVGWGRSAAVAALLAPVLIATAPAAGAHTQLVDTEPANRSVVAGATEVALQFDGEVLDLGAAMRVTGPGGEVSAGRPSVDGARITQPLRAALAEGTYQVLWRATAADGHAASGSWQFTVSASGTSPSSAAAPSQPGPAPEPGTVDGPGAWLLDAMIASAVLALLGTCAVVLVARRRREG
jgi:methionine-rich copper-binding protein CopC